MGKCQRDNHQLPVIKYVYKIKRLDIGVQSSMNGELTHFVQSCQ